jgi:preprotein translocase subunit YajC
VNTLATILAAEESSGSPLGILILIIPFGLLIWLMVVPQRKQKARQQQLMTALAVGDEVMTTGGIVGQITYLDDDLAHLEIDHDVVIRVAKSAIARSMEEPDPAAAPTRSRGGLLGGLMGGGAAADADDAVDVRTKSSAKPSTKSGTGVGTARSGSAKAPSRKK